MSVFIGLLVLVMATVAASVAVIPCIYPKEKDMAEKEIREIRKDIGRATTALRQWNNKTLLTADEESKDAAHAAYAAMNRLYEALDGEVDLTSNTIKISEIDAKLAHIIELLGIR